MAGRIDAGRSAFMGMLKQHISKWIPSFGWPQAVVAGVILALNVVFLAIVALKNEFLLSDPLVASSFAVKILFDLALWLLLAQLLRGIFRTAWVAASFLAFNLLLNIANILLYYFGNTMVERHHFALITPYSVTAFVPWWALLAVFATVGLSVVLFHRVVRAVPLQHLFRKSVVYLLVLAALTVVNRASLFARKDDEKLDKVVMGFRNAQVYYACRNQFLSLIKDVAFPALGGKLKALSPSTESFVDDYNLISDRFKLESDISRYGKTIREYGLSVGPAKYEDLGLKPFTRVIYILAESISLDALPCHNPKIGAAFADRFFCSEGIREQTFTNLYTSGSPTLQGLTTIFNSHPNYTVAEPTGHPNSFPKLLERMGYKSVFIRSASKYFANENLVFRNMGFSEIIGREDFFDDESLRKYIYGWGLEDRILYRKVTEYLEKNRGRKLFVAVFGTDTHPPYGQVQYRGLKYPGRPTLKKTVHKDTFEWLRSVDNMDFDIAEFIKDLDKKGLFDENTLIVVSADHSCPVNNVTSRIPGHPRTNLAKMPVVFVSKQQLPDAKRDSLASEIDIAPTLFHLMGIEKAPGWWGDSLFNPERRRYAIGYDKGFVRFKDEKRELMINAEKPKGGSQKAFLDFFHVMYVPGKTQKRPGN